MTDAARKRAEARERTRHRKIVADIHLAFGGYLRWARTLGFASGKDAIDFVEDIIERRDSALQYLDELHAARADDPGGRPAP